MIGLDGALSEPCADGREERECMGGEGDTGHTGHVCHDAGGGPDSLLVHVRARNRQSSAHPIKVNLVRREGCAPWKRLAWVGEEI